MKRLLIVDDSALMRRTLTDVFQETGRYEIRTARSGLDALAQIAAFDPHVVTLDINMPEMDGLAALSRIMLESPRPVVMVSSLTEPGALATFEALELGAVDYLPKPGGTISLNIRTVAAMLVAKVDAAAGAKVGRTKAGAPRTAAEPRAARGAAKPVRPVSDGTGCVLIGVSTGGPRALEEILPKLPADFPMPVVVAQHMPASFTGPFARRLDALCALDVVEVAQPMPLAVGRVHVAKGDADLAFSRRGATLHVVPMPPDASQLWHPSVDRMVRSALEHFPADELIGVQLTGMGDDGAAAMAELRSRGGRTIAQSEQSAVVWGMPGELVRRGGATLVMAPDAIARQLPVWSRARSLA